MSKAIKMNNWSRNHHQEYISRTHCPISRDFGRVKHSVAALKQNQPKFLSFAGRKCRSMNAKDENYQKRKNDQNPRLMDYYLKKEHLKDYTYKSTNDQDSIADRNRRRNQDFISFYYDDEEDDPKKEQDLSRSFIGKNERSTDNDLSGIKFNQRGHQLMNFKSSGNYPSKAPKPELPKSKNEADSEFDQCMYFLPDNKLDRLNSDLRFPIRESEEDIIQTSRRKEKVEFIKNYVVKEPSNLDIMFNKKERKKSKDKYKLPDRRLMAPKPKKAKKSPYSPIKSKSEVFETNLAREVKERFERYKRMGSKSTKFIKFNNFKSNPKVKSNSTREILKPSSFDQSSCLYMSSKPKDKSKSLSIFATNGGEGSKKVRFERKMVVYTYKKRDKIQKWNSPARKKHRKKSGLDLRLKRINKDLF